MWSYTLNLIKSVWEHEGRDYYERVIDAVDCIRSSITRMRARGIIDPEVYRAYEEACLKL